MRIDDGVIMKLKMTKVDLMKNSGSLYPENFPNKNRTY